MNVVTGHLVPEAIGGRNVARPDVLNTLSRWATRGVLIIAVLAAIAAPVMATAWSQRPYPGFLVDPTLVVNAGSERGDGALENVRFPHRVVAISGAEVNDSQAFYAELAEHEIGDRLTAFVETQGGVEYPVHPVVLIRFPKGEMIRQFWLPYVIGLAYLVIGVWAYAVQGGTRPGRALAFFCGCTALVTILLFDLSTTHIAPELWIAAMAFEGGTLISLAMRFPSEWVVVTRRPWLLAGPYVLSGVLAVWGIAMLMATDPWAYIRPFGIIYRYAAIGTLFFLGVSLFQARHSASPLVRRQARIVVLGSAIAFLPLTVYFLAPLVGQRIAFEPVWMLPTMILFPLAVAVAIVRFRLWQLDSVVSRTVVFGSLTAILAGVYAAFTALLQKLFIAVTGDRSDAAIVITTLIIAAAIQPVRNWIQGSMERTFHDPLKRLEPLKEFGNQVEAFVEMSDPHRAAQRLVERTARSLGASSAILRLGGTVDPAWEATHGFWRGRAVASMPIVRSGRTVGLFQLASREAEEAYRPGEIEDACREVTRVVDALALDERLSDRPSGLRPVNQTEGETLPPFQSLGRST